MTLREVFSSIANAIRSKTGKTDTIKPVDMATEIQSIQTGSGGNPMQEYVNNNGGDGKPSCYYLFYNYQGTSLDSVLKSLDFSKVTNMSSMFESCSNLTSISQLDTSKVTNMNYMFFACFKLKKIDITKLISNSSFANSCYSLKTLIIRTMDTIPTLNSSTFNNCYHFYGTTNETYNPEGLKDGAIYVPDNKVEELKVATNWSVFADIIKPLSTLV